MAGTRKVGKTDSEFGDGPGLIDATRRSDRIIGQDATAMGYQRMGEELLEIYATNPADPNSTPEEAPLGLDRNTGR